jgi:histidinol-phosphate/aromatic aminotransferase/cobyric acid decarboxylase-like protein
MHARSRPGCIPTAAATCSSTSCEAARRRRQQITLGNGSNDALVLLAEAFLARPRSGVFALRFRGLSDRHQATGATGRAYALPAESAMRLGHDLAAMARADHERTRIVFVANPNNPTGTWVRRARLEAFIAAMPRHVIVALDEAYFEYRRARPAERHRVAAAIPEPRRVPHLLEGLRPRRVRVGTR